MSGKFVDINNKKYHSVYAEYLYSHIPEAIKLIKDCPNISINNTIFNIDHKANLIIFKKVKNEEGDIFTINISSLYSYFKTVILIKDDFDRFGFCVTSYLDKIKEHHNASFTNTSTQN